MSIINVMWAGGAPFASVHKVHNQILSRMEPAMPVKTWLLQGSAAACQIDVGATLEWNMTSARLKGRHVWRLLKPLMRSRFRQALLDSDARVVLLDGIGVARTLLPVLKAMPQIRVVVIFPWCDAPQSFGSRTAARLPCLPPDPGSGLPDPGDIAPGRVGHAGRCAA